MPAVSWRGSLGFGSGASESTVTHFGEPTTGSLGRRVAAARAAAASFRWARLTRRRALPGGSGSLTHTRVSLRALEGSATESQLSK